MIAPEPKDIDDSFDAPAAQVAEQTSSGQALAAALDRAREHSERQGWIAKLIIVAYCIIIACAVVVDILAGWLPPRQAGLSAAAGEIKDMANTLVLPLVTLVIGHYFGQRSK